MRARVDFEKRLITAGIGDLVAPSPAGPGSLGLFAQLRAELGNKFHRRYRGERKAGHPGFSSEVAVEMTRDIAGFTARIRGRVDGIVDHGAAITVEEVKSVTLSGGQLGRAVAGDFPDYCAQARLYALCLAQGGESRPIGVRLVLYSVLDETRRELEVGFAAGAVAVELDELLRGCLAEAEKERERALARAGTAEKLRFPYAQARAHQGELTEFFLAGLRRGRPVLAMAPTGIGKTVCALLAGLRFSLAGNGLLFFLTAKTIQQDLVGRTVTDIVAASGLGPGSLTALTLRAKERMCPPGTLNCHPDACPLLEKFLERANPEQALAQLGAGGPSIGPDAVFEYGTAQRLCPFELSLLLAARVDLVICDYNYFYDPSISLGLLSGEPGTRPAVAIVDEAHNLFDRARGYYSPFVGQTLLDEALAALAEGRYLPPEKGGGQLAFEHIFSVVPGEALFAELADFCRELGQELAEAYAGAAAAQAAAAAVEDGFFDQRPTSEASVAERGFIDDRAPINPGRDRWAELAETAAALLIRFSIYKFSHAIAVPHDPVPQLLRAVLRLRDGLVEDQPEFVPYVAGPAGADGAGVGVLCLNPATRLEKRNKEVLGTLAMSATLTPLSYYSEVLGFSALEPQTTSAPSPFPTEHRRIVIVPTVSTTYRRRERHLNDIAILIRDIVRIRRGRYIAFFPSFSFLSKVRERLELPGSQIQAQLPDMANTARRRVLNKFSKGKGSQLLLAVMGGTFAEGIDLPGEALIGAIVVGPGLPAIGFERALMREYFEERYQSGFAYAMLYPGMQRVIQSAGRVIRSMEDKGVIALLGHRFAEPAYAQCLPPDWYDNDSRELVTRDPVQRLTEFWSAWPGAQPSGEGPRS